MFKFFKKFSFANRLLSLFQRKVDGEMLDDCERLFFEADLGSDIASSLTEKAKSLLRKEIKGEEMLLELENALLKLLPLEPPPFTIKHKPHVVFVIGINGCGKTTTSAKLAHLFSSNHQVMLAAADTFRSAAIDQLSQWAERLHIDIVKGQPGGDPAAVCFDAISAAIHRGTDLLIIDTAGRLHTRDDLLKELTKMRSVANKVLPGAPHDSFLVLDATIGQNCIIQAETFHKAIPLTGLILTKMDGTAKGGAILNIQRKLNLPITYLGTGEKAEDLVPFDTREFVSALFR